MSKGQAMSFSEILTYLIIIGIIVVFIMLVYGKYFDMHTIVKENEVERHAIVFANVLLSYDKLAYSDGDKLHRGIFEKSKLDNVLFKKSDLGFYDPASIFGPKEDIQISYPNSIAMISVVDLQTNDAWFATVYGHFTSEGSSASKMTSCLINNVKLSSWQDVVQAFFRYPVPGPWENIDLDKCGITFASSMGISSEGFPVAIRVSGDEVHVGRIIVSLMEL
jgi:hypothetical protein